ncbi:GNAT family N-acetyltransferase [Streptomyces sp. NPDC057682]|uniref:GNAT family N-acetyltransferase n=1 Tax=Streptomyces sp. NPDC057682 TaxID=3346210 RepID=UPI00369D6B86
MLRLARTRPDGLDALLRMEETPDVARWLGDTGRPWHEQVLADPRQTHWTAFHRDRPVGFAVVVTHPGPETEIRRLVVDPRHQGFGHGRELLREVLRRAGAASPAGRIFLDVRPENTRARALYAAEGFTDSARIDSAYGPLVVMARAGDPPAGGDTE